MSTVRWGIVGTGGIAGAFAREFPHIENGEVVAVASRTAERAEAFAGEHGIAHAHGSYQALYHDPEVDAVYVATPHSLHAENAADALRAGKAVLCEKPLTATPDEARALVDVARETGGYLLEGMWTHFLPAVRTALGWVAEGRIGTVLHVKADFGYRHPYDPAHPESRMYNPDLAGGALLDMGVYPVSLAWLFLQRHPTAISAVAHRAPTGVDDDVTMRFDYPDAVATLATSFRGRLPNAAWVIGDEGTVEIPDFFRARACSLWHGDERVDHFDDGRESLGFEFEVRAAGEDILAGRQQSAVVPWASSLAVQDHLARVSDAI
ncbi:Gfo/Idh/MocA family protein [Rubrivirga sp.]|uniref:Gfo/Idh/MocA family protein n=1 Tax=Rubrivirga sp. TaxID=1885344 RepID=UPI003B529627